MMLLLSNLLLAPARVVEVNVSLTPPIVRIVFVAVELLAEEVWRTVTLSPLTTVPGDDV